MPALQTVKVNMTPEEMLKEIERLKAKVEKQSVMSYKVSPKGALSVYGLQRFPVTLYEEQWERIFEHEDAIKTFIDSHEKELKDKE